MKFQFSKTLSSVSLKRIVSQMGSENEQEKLKLNSWGDSFKRNQFPKLSGFGASMTNLYEH